MFPRLNKDGTCAEILRVATVAALCLLVLLPARTWLAPLFGKTMTPHHPYAVLADAIRRHCPAARTVVAESLLSAGNLRFARPAVSTLLLLEDARRAHLPRAGPAALVAHTQDAAAALAVFHAVWPGARLEGRDELRLALEDGTARHMAFMLACVARAPPSKGNG